MTMTKSAPNPATEPRTPRILTPQERAARTETRRIEAEQAMKEHNAAQEAFYANKERLRAERLAREAAEAGK